MADVALKECETAECGEHSEFAAGYNRMAANMEREDEALAWSNALIGDSFEEK